MICERDTPSDLLQHLAEFQANCMQLSHFESKPVWFLRLHIYLLDVSGNRPPYTHFQAEELGQVVSYCRVSPAVIGEVTCQAVQDNNLPPSSLALFLRGGCVLAFAV